MFGNVNISNYFAPDNGSTFDAPTSTVQEFKDDGWNVRYLKPTESRPYGVLALKKDGNTLIATEAKENEGKPDADTTIVFGTNEKGEDRMYYTNGIGEEL